MSQMNSSVLCEYILNIMHEFEMEGSNAGKSFDEWRYKR